ncbi:hypothetical protein WUBG_14832 [Wuchereria bancrofti]|uniref:Uncharacterized protein n=1 Tax=Wuchereria bancrofti TaxID=6293 RepID=J9EFS2_WUCBA|nr:hypothetical protein WUBG_14832 [Wuchereria bancrofti]
MEKLYLRNTQSRHYEEVTTAYALLSISIYLNQELESTGLTTVLGEYIPTSTYQNSNTTCNINVIQAPEVALVLVKLPRTEMKTKSLSRYKDLEAFTDLKKFQQKHHRCNNED